MPPSAISLLATLGGTRRGPPTDTAIATAPFNIDETLPGDTDVVSAFPANERANRDKIESALAIEHDMGNASSGKTGHHKIGVGSTATRDATTDWVVGSIWFNTTTSPAKLQRVVSVGPVVWETISDLALAALLASANTFTVKQTINTGASLGDALEIISTDAGATGGPDHSFFRDSASPAANDTLTRIIWRGRDSAANKQDYAFIVVTATNVTSTTEAAVMDFYTYVAGAAARGISLGAGLQVGSPAGGDPGAGKLNVANDIQLGGVSLIHGIGDVQTVMYTANTTLSTSIPHDDTIPQNTEGTQLLTITMTPLNASSTILIRAGGMFGGSNIWNSIALFKDSTANALAATSAELPAASIETTNYLEFSESAGSLTSRTYKLRAGPSSGSTATNGNPAARIFGGVAVISLTVIEIFP